MVCPWSLIRIKIKNYDSPRTYTINQQVFFHTMLVNNPDGYWRFPKKQKTKYETANVYQQLILLEGGYQRKRNTKSAFQGNVIFQEKVLAGGRYFFLLHASHQPSTAAEIKREGL